MSELKRLRERQKELQAKLQDLTEDQVWNADYEGAIDRQFAEKCMPPQQRPKLNLKVINISE